MQTVYTVRESEGHVNVSVHLTHPEHFDVLDAATVQVESFNYESSRYIPAGAVLASELLLFHFRLIRFAKLGSVS